MNYEVEDGKPKPGCIPMSPLKD